MFPVNFGLDFFLMSPKNIKFTVLLPILERADIIKGFPLSIESIFLNTLIPDQVVVTIDGPVSENFKSTILFSICPIRLSFALEKLQTRLRKLP